MVDAPAHRSRVWSWLGWFLLGVLATIVGLAVAAFLFVKSGAISMATTASPLPFEKAVASMALHASIGNARNEKNPLPLTDANLLAGANEYREHCAFCHGTPGRPSAALKTMFPKPPQLFEKRQMVTDDPEGVTYWKVTHGIRLSGMPGFATLLSDTKRWQVTMLVAHADRLPPGLTRALERQLAAPAQP